MKASLAACIFAGAFNFAWAAILVHLVRLGLASPWICWLLPLPILAGGFILSVPLRYWRATRRSKRAAGDAPTTPAFHHAPHSFPAPARDHVHRSVDLPARDDR